MGSIKNTFIATHKFRNKFIIPNKTILQWYPGHMNKGMKQMQQKLKSVDCIIEVHDARIPLSGRNPNFVKTITGLRPHIVVYNKIDLSDLTYVNQIKSTLKSQGEQNVLFTNCKSATCNGVQKIIPLVTELVSSGNRFNRSEEKEYSIMVIGIPNVGKSSLINVIRNKYLKQSNAAAVGSNAGITRSVTTKVKVCENPLIYIFDTPGILTPKVPNVEVGMRLALCATIPDTIVGVEYVADYLLYWLNKNDNLRYVDYFGIKEPSDNISEVLVLAAVNLNKMIRRVNEHGQYCLYPNTHAVAINFVDAFRRGLFGQITLDCDKLSINT